MAAQAQLMGHLDRSIGTIESVFLTYGSGAVVIGLILLAVRGGNLGSWHIPPWYAYSAGLFGLVIVGRQHSSQDGRDTTTEENTDQASVVDC
jgi:transporter family-2 protein